ncbi:MAG: hypothetical protein LCH78_11565 [Proteobacteria bacterium]|nr:hypothetical protein [Pseudomonadota bacterium]
MGVCAALLVGLLVIQTPVSATDRMLHAMGQAHAANPFAGAVSDLHLDGSDHDHDHGQEAGYADAHSHEMANAAADDGGPDDRGSAAPHHHHHHDNPTAYGLTLSPSLPVRWATSRSLFGAEDDLRPGLAPQMQDRPPKVRLAYVA